MTVPSSGRAARTARGEPILSWWRRERLQIVLWAVLVVAVAAAGGAVVITNGVPMPRWAPYGLFGAILVSMVFGAARRVEDGAMIAGLPAAVAAPMLLPEHLFRPLPALGRDGTLWLLLLSAVATGAIVWIYLGYADGDADAGSRPPAGPVLGSCRRCGADLFADPENRGWCYSVDYEYQCPPTLRTGDDRPHQLVPVPPR